MRKQLAAAVFLMTPAGLVAQQPPRVPIPSVPDPLEQVLRNAAEQAVCFSTTDPKSAADKNLNIQCKTASVDVRSIMDLVDRRVDEKGKKIDTSTVTITNPAIDPETRQPAMAHWKGDVQKIRKLQEFAKDKNIVLHIYPGPKEEIQVMSNATVVGISSAAVNKFSVEKLMADLSTAIKNSKQPQHPGR